MIVVAVSFRFPGCNWLHDRDRLKRKQKGNFKTKQCSWQQLGLDDTHLGLGDYHLGLDNDISANMSEQRWRSNEGVPRYF